MKTITHIPIYLGNCLQIGMRFVFDNEERVRRILKYAAARDEEGGHKYRPRCE